MADGVANLLSGYNRYNPENIPKLEAHVEQQVQSNTYDFDANIALLKLYQFFPEKVNTNVITLILGKALMNLPRLDYSLCVRLLQGISDNVDVAIRDVNRVGSMLEQAEFTDFWKTESKKIFANIPNFDETIRKYILNLLKLTYQSISKNLILELLNLDESGLTELVKSDDIVVEETTVKFTLTAYNQATPKVRAENIPYSQLSKFLSKQW